MTLHSDIVVQLEAKLSTILDVNCLLASGKDQEKGTTIHIQSKLEDVDIPCSPILFVLENGPTVMVMLIGDEKKYWHFHELTLDKITDICNQAVDEYYHGSRFKEFTPSLYK